MDLAREKRLLLDMNGYQWTVLLAAWLGWGFDVFDGLLFNYVAPDCVPTLLHIPPGSAAARSATLFWTGTLTSLLLLGWAAGGVIFGRIADRLGRTRTLLLTMILYAVGTACCAMAPNLWVLAACRLVASLGIGGEWAAGAAMVAEVVPEKRRVEAGALLYTSAPFGLFLATFVVYQIAGVYLKDSPELSWRYVFLCGLLPAAVALLVRSFVKEPKRWVEAGSSARASARELFTPQYRALTLSGLSMALTALLAWWSTNAFIPVVVTNLAKSNSLTAGHSEEWKQFATSLFNLGGLIGTLLTIPAAKIWGRRAMFAVYFALSGATLLAAFGLHMPPYDRLYFYFPIGLTVFGIFGSFTFYLPELFPTRLRATGAGFCYNIGRVITSGGPFIISLIASRSTDVVGATLHAMFWIGFIPLAGLCATPFIVETRGRLLAD